MSTPASTGLSAPSAPPVAKERRRLPRWWPVAALVVAIAVLSLLRIVTGADDLTSAGTIGATLVATIPIMLAGLGGLWSERAGVVNIGLEGMMILGTYGAGYFGYHYGAWAGVLGAIALGAVGGLIHAVATVLFGVDHVISGVAINIIALGAVQYLAALTFTGKPGGGQTQSPKIPDLPALTITPLSNSLGDLEDKEWFFVSEVAALLRALVTNLSVLVIISLLLLVVSWWVLWRTPFGLRLRSCGESPAAAESLGVAVLRYKFAAVIISGSLAGLAGGVLAIVASSNYRDGQTGGRGYIGLAAMIFGNWRPGGLLAGSGLFGYTQTLGLRQGGDSVHALLLAVAVLALALAVLRVRSTGPLVLGAVVALSVVGTLLLGLVFAGPWWLVLVVLVLLAAALAVMIITVAAGPRRDGIFIAAMAAVVGGVYITIDTVPDDFTTMTPYVITLLVLAFASQRLRMPAADGQVYRKGSAG